MQPRGIRGPAQDSEGRIPRQDLRGQEHDDRNHEQGYHADSQPACGESKQGMLVRPRDGLLSRGGSYRHVLTRHQTSMLSRNRAGWRAGYLSRR
jgi:hypothetical protein